MLALALERSAFYARLGSDGAMRVGRDLAVNGIAVRERVWRLRSLYLCYHRDFHLRQKRAGRGARATCD